MKRNMFTVHLMTWPEAKHVKHNQKTTFGAIEDEPLARALNELGRSINLYTTYGKNHPAVEKALQAAYDAFEDLFTERRKLTIGSFNGVLLVDEETVQTSGTLQKSLERKLVGLSITGLRIARGIRKPFQIDYGVVDRGAFGVLHTVSLELRR